MHICSLRLLPGGVLGSGLVDLLTGPHGVDRYTELVAPTWSLSDARARVVSVKHRTPRGVTLTLAPNDAFLFRRTATRRSRSRSGRSASGTRSLTTPGRCTGSSAPWSAR